MKWRMQALVFVDQIFYAGIRPRLDSKTSDLNRGLEYSLDLSFAIDLVCFEEKSQRRTFSDAIPWIITGQLCLRGFSLPR